MARHALARWRDTRLPDGAPPYRVARMRVIRDTDCLAAFCDRLAAAPYITVDTEFMRERTYWPKLCLVQIAGPDDVAIIDAVSPDLDLAPLFGLMVNEAVLKVFHAARQDIEILYHLSGRIPAPIFDTQVAAMVCGFGESVAYDTLAAKLANARIDKTSRFTDWSQRPLTDKQLQYALADVTHLRTAYEKIAERLAETGRTDWLREEMAVLTAPATYDIDPREAWRRIRTRTAAPRFLAILRELAAWREEEARRRDVPRPRILRDESLIEIAAHPPATPEALARMRGLGRDLAFGALGRGILAAVAQGQAVPQADCPVPERRAPLPGGLAPVVELLRVLLRAKAEASDVAARLIASGDDLERIAASDEAGVPALSGWRREIFGEAALALKNGRLALTIKNRRLDLVPSGPGADGPRA